MSQDSKKTILGLDLGTNSIGWALVETDTSETPSRILGMGSRIIPLDSNERDQFQKGQAISKNQERTRSRTQRRGYDRLQLRKARLKALLQILNIFPGEELMKLPALDLWELRSAAATRPISEQQLGRVLYMINQKRGYKSARTAANADKKDTEYVAEVKGRYQQLKERKQTIGQMFFEELKRASNSREHFQVKKKVYPREAYIEEFDQIVRVQRDHHKFLTTEIIDEIRNGILYYQRPLKSQKGLVSICELEGSESISLDEKTGKQKTSFVGPKVAPRSSPMAQLCRIWENVNNISFKVKSPKGAKYKWEDRFPTFEEKQEIVRRLSTSESVSLAELLQIINLKKDEIYANKQLQKGIKGSSTYASLFSVLGQDENLRFETKLEPSNHESILVDKSTGEILEEREPVKLHSDLEKEPLYQLWHTVYSIKDLDECKAALVKRFNFTAEIAEKLAALDLNSSGFGNKSNRAMRKILPCLMEGFNYSDACSLAGYNHSNVLTRSERLARPTADKLELIPKNGLRQPVVEKVLNQMINVVNAIIEKYGKPHEIRVELARELKQSKDEREDADKQNTFNKAVNDEIAKRLKEYGLSPTKKYIQKYKFIFPTRDKKWKEAQVFNQCIYCGEQFNVSEALGGDNFDVDHIIPQALLFDDSQMNKVLVHRSCNANKTNQTAYDYIASKGEGALESYIKRVEDWFKRGVLSYGKMQRLKVSFKEYQERKKSGSVTDSDKKLWESFIDRQLRETQYIARQARSILEKICNNVTATEGNVTSKLRQLWGWNEVLMNLQLDKYKRLGQTELKHWTSEHGKRTHQKEVILNWSKRDDHRHHAIDALVVACTKQGFIQRINTLNASEVREEMNRNVESAKEAFNERMTLLEKYLISQKPQKFTTQLIEDEASKILVSFKPGKKVATISRYKALGKNKESGVIIPRGQLHEQFIYGKIGLDGSDEYVLKYKLQDIKSKDVPSIIDKRVRELVAERLNQFQGKEKEAFKEVLWFDKEKGIPIYSVRCRTGLKAVQAVKMDESGRYIGFAKPGNNHHVAIYVDGEGKYHQHICTFWHAVDRRRYGIQTVIRDTNFVWSDVLGKEYAQTFLEKLPPDNVNLYLSMQQNEMVVLGLSEENFKTALRNGDYALLSQHLYLVWSVSDNDYWFRHHLETKNSELKKTNGAKESKRFRRFQSVKALLTENPIKVRLNHLGEITKVGDN